MRADLYLNFDGVLLPFVNSIAAGADVIGLEQPPQMAHARALEAAVLPYANVSIVLNTWWTVRLGRTACIGMLPQSLQARVEDDVFDGRDERLDGGFSCSRVALTLRSIERRRNDRWLLLDHAACSWPVCVLRHAVLLHPACGLGATGAVEHVRQMIERCLAFDTKMCLKRQNRLSLIESSRPAFRHESGYEEVTSRP